MNTRILITHVERLSPRCANRKSRAGFTLVELGVVVGMTCLLVLVLTPALASTRANGKAFQCLNNTKQLTTGWLMYAGDHQDTMIDATKWVTGSMNSATPGGPWTSTGSE